MKLKLMLHWNDDWLLNNTLLLNHYESFAMVEIILVIDIRSELNVDTDWIEIVHYTSI